ncbi:hypothetical protein BDB00DRAFT_833687 [Zychaea mexicana]|uniref:uncharacterized protein n=1 Tax=Zychaea mexicana TaxID=64656 RepID=UPI0022FE265B|nr:uncharacterized protein BDB00DRAFT_833687 [Zychaea mexicana]KAI9491257.1 hypothetical protein BDB00DRAFT_833687 [Zychaea mexicana]
MIRGSKSLSAKTATAALYSRAALVLLLITTILSAVSQAINVDIRSDTECVYLSRRIWCYGGQGDFDSSSDNMVSVIADKPLFFSLDPSQNTTPYDMKFTFVAENDVGPNLYHTLVAVPTLNTIVMDGGMGLGDGTTIPQHRTTIYNTDSGTWTKNTSSPHMRVYGHTATLGPNNTIYFWGGRRDQNTTGEEGTLVDIPFRMHWFNVAENAWSLGSPVHTITERRQYHEAVLGKDGSSIYYIGGIMPMSILNQYGMTDYHDYADVPMNVITIFDTKSGAWRSENTTGPVVPSTRMRHTLTLKPSTGEIILIGGIGPLGSRPREDYFYILDTDKLEWSNRTITMEDSSGITKGVCGHSGMSFCLFLHYNFLSLPCLFEKKRGGRTVA